MSAIPDEEATRRVENFKKLIAYYEDWDLQEKSIAEMARCLMSSIPTPDDWGVRQLFSDFDLIEQRLPEFIRDARLILRGEEPEHVTYTMMEESR